MPLGGGRGSVGDSSLFFSCYHSLPFLTFFYRDFCAIPPAEDKYSPNSFTSLRVMFLVAAQSVFVVRMVLITSSKRVGERRTRPRARFLARASFGSPREA